MKKFKNFVSEKMEKVTEKVEEFCEDHLHTIVVATNVGFYGIVAAAYCVYLKNASKKDFKGS